MLTCLILLAHVSGCAGGDDIPRIAPWTEPIVDIEVEVPRLPVDGPKEFLDLLDESLDAEDIEAEHETEGSGPVHRVWEDGEDGADGKGEMWNGGIIRKNGVMEYWGLGNGVAFGYTRGGQSRRMCRRGCFPPRTPQPIRQSPDADWSLARLLWSTPVNRKL